MLKECRECNNYSRPGVVISCALYDSRSYSSHCTYCEWLSLELCSTQPAQLCVAALGKGAARKCIQEITKIKLDFEIHKGFPHVKKERKGIPA